MSTLSLPLPSHLSFTAISIALFLSPSISLSLSLPLSLHLTLHTSLTAGLHLYTFLPPSHALSNSLFRPIFHCSSLPPSETHLSVFIHPSFLHLPRMTASASSGPHAGCHSYCQQVAALSLGVLREREREREWCLPLTW